MRIIPVLGVLLPTLSRIYDVPVSTCYQANLKYIPLYLEGLSPVLTTDASISINIS